MKRISLLALVLIAFCLVPCRAQITHTADGAVDATATTLLKKAAEKMSKETLSFSVAVANYDAEKNKTFSQKAQITYMAPSYVVKAGDIDIYCDGKSVWQVNHTSREVVITNMTDSDNDLTNPAAMLASYSKNYRPKFIREENGTAIIDLQPKKAARYHKLRLFIETSTGRLKKIEQHNYDSSRGEYTFSNYTTPKPTATTFTCTPPKGYEVVDMR